MVQAIQALITSAAESRARRWFAWTCRAVVFFAVCLLLVGPVLAQEKVSYRAQPPPEWRAPPGLSAIYVVSREEMQRMCGARATFELKRGEEYAECVFAGLGVMPDPCDPQFRFDGYAQRFCHLRAHQAGWAADHPRK